MQPHMATTGVHSSMKALDTGVIPWPYQLRVSINRRPLNTHLSIPVRNNYRVTGELSRGDELPNGFLDGSRRVQLSQEESPQGR
jgi:hypothetical protein